MDNFPAEQSQRELLPTGQFKDLAARRLKASTCMRFEYFLSSPYQVANYYDADRNLVAQKLRTKDKNFFTKGSMAGKPLFGQQQFLGTHADRLIITEGEIDAMTVSQVIGSKWPVVSVCSGVGSLKESLVQNMHWINQFERVVLFMDNDEVGQATAKECLKVLPAGKAYNAVINGFKDASEAHIALADEAIEEAIAKAERYKPLGVYTAEEVMEMGDLEIKEGAEFPFPSMTQWTYGQRPHEMIAYGAGTGVGKTDLLKTIAAQNIKNGRKQGLIFLEETQLNLTVATIAGKIDGCLYHVPNVAFNEDQFERTKALIKDKLMMFKVESSLEPEDMLNTVRYLALSGCQDIFLDHITYVMDGVGESAGISVLKKFMKDLNDLNKELPFTLHYVSHLRKSASGNATHEEGGRVTLDDFAGGKANVQYANFVFALERDQQSEQDSSRNLSILRCLKDRFTGLSTGKTATLIYDPATGNKTEKDPLFD